MSAPPHTTTAGRPVRISDAALTTSRWPGPARQVGRPATPPAGPPPRWLLQLTSLLLVACTIPWRRATYFSGALDPVVAAKGLIGALALALAAYCAIRAPLRTRVGARTLTLATAYLTISVIGGWSAGALLPSVVVAVRVGMLLLSLLLLLVAFGLDDFAHAVLRSLGVVGILAAVTGAPTLASGRLSGGVPPVAPNEIAFLSGVIILLTAQRLIEGRARRWEVGLVVALAGAVWLTGSRTTLATLVLACVAMAVQARRIAVPAFIAMVLAVPAAAFTVFATSAVTGLLLRGGDQNVTTLASRTIAWQSALTMDTTWWQHWFGGGLTLKHIPVSGQYWETQLLDSSWVSALVQAGLLGIGVAALWVLTTTGAALRSGRPWRPLWVGLLIFTVLRSLLESGMFDASTSFMVFAVVSLAVERSVRADPRTLPAADTLTGPPTTVRPSTGRPRAGRVPIGQAPRAAAVSTSRTALR